ncbi:MAG TPA: hypothetical protein VNH18_29535 [Bryobacteraceae bacterium]|nr:hypothetical protein [Blastocatellia bacterium]HXJ43461.1 hypothetical protein [Bryobacteraceae bacterium]
MLDTKPQDAGAADIRPSLESRIADAIADWCGSPPSKFSQMLEELWQASAFYPHKLYDPFGIELLLRALDREYRTPPAYHVALSPSHFQAGGRIFTVQQLIDEAAAFERWAEVPVEIEE